LAEDVIEDTGKLGSVSEAGRHVPSLSLSAQIHLADSTQRAEFLQELQTTFQALALKYGVAQNDDDADDDTRKSANRRVVMMLDPKREINQQETSWPCFRLLVSRSG